MSRYQGDNGYNRGGNDRSVNRGDDGGLSVTRTFNNNGGGNRSNNYDNRGGNSGYNNNRGQSNDNYRGGGGGRGGNYNNGNNYQNNHHNQNRNHQGGRGGGGAGRGADAPKKLPGNMMPRKEDVIPTSVQMAHQIMTRLGDFSAMTEQDDLYANIQALAHTFVSVGDLKEYSHEISDLFVRCFSQLSVQTPILASLLSLIHTHEPAFTSEVAAKLQARYLAALSQDEVVVAKLLLRAVVCLSGAEVFEVVGSGGLVEVLTPLLTGLTQELEHNTDTSKALQLSEAAQAGAYLLATTLVWAAPVLAQAHQTAFLETARTALHTVKTRYVSVYALGGLQAVFNSFSPAESEGVVSEGPALHSDVLGDASAWDSVWEAAVQAVNVIDSVAQTAAEGGVYVYPAYFNAHWVALLTDNLLPSSTTSADDTTTARVKLSFGTSFSTDYAAHSSGLGTKAAHCHPSGACTTALGSAAASSYLRLRMNVFDTESSPECAQTCALSSLAKYAAFTYLEDVFTFFDPVINEDGTKLGSMELLTTHLIAVFKLFPDSHVEYVLIELLLQVVLQQPVNTTLGTSVFRLVLELCRAAPLVFPPVVALAANTIFQLLPDLDSGSVLEFGRWFSFHLINTQLAWPAHYWSFWVSELQDAVDSNQSGIPLFIRFIIEKISYAAIPEKVRTAIPEALHHYIPATTAAKCILFQETTQISNLSHIPGIRAEARHLSKLIEDKTDPEEVGDWLEEVAPGASEGIEHFSATGEPFCWRGCLLLQTLLHVGSETGTLSGVVGLLDRYAEPLLTHVTTEEHHLDLLATLAEVYGGPNSTTTDTSDNTTSASNNYMYHYLLDESLRRGLIGVSAAAKVLVAAQAGDWRGNPCVYECVESLLDRTVDFVRAAVAQRALLGSVGLVLDETLDLTSVDAPEEEGNAAAVVEVTGDEQVDYDEEMDSEEREEGNRKRTRRDPTTTDPDGMEVTTAKGEAHPLWAAEESLKDAIRNARNVYSTVTAALLTAIVTSNSESMDEGEDVGAAVTAASLLRRTLRVFHGTERHLSHQHQVRVVVGASPSEVQALLTQLAVQSGVDTARWAAQIGIQ